MRNSLWSSTQVYLRLQAPRSSISFIEIDDYPNDIQIFNLCIIIFIYNLSESRIFTEDETEENESELDVYM